MFTSSNNAFIYFIFLIWCIDCGHVVIVAVRNGGTTASRPTIIDTDDTDKAICQNDIEWKTNPILCNVLQRLQPPATSPPVQRSTTESLPSSSQQQQQLHHHRHHRQNSNNNNNNDDDDDNDDCTIMRRMMITSTDLYQFASAMRWIVDLRDINEKSLEIESYKSGITSSSSSSSTSSSTATVSSQRMLRQTHNRTTATTTNKIPVVIAHGMGDSCYNDGMVHFTKFVSSLLQNVYTVCIPIGSSPSEDTNNGYFLNMNDSIDYFAQKVKEDTQLMMASTFYAIGLSQGNNIIRGYIAKYNSILPSVHTFISINGVNAGIGAVPHCIPEQILQRNRQEQASLSTSGGTSSSSSLLSSEIAFTMCDLLMEQASAAAYTTFAQKHSFQANYWRDPRPSEYDTYRTYSQLAKLNNEVLDPSQFNKTLQVNWSYTSKFVWIMAQDDRTVWPPLGEQWGAPDPQDPFRHMFYMNETAWYKNDYFGLRTAQEQNKNYFESFPGDHLQFTKEDLQRWVETYLS